VEAAAEGQHAAWNVEQMKYLIVCEKSNAGWGAYAPDLPGLGAAGKTLDEVKDRGG
jgi:predicted RNase H-like HicB family nuclease